ncbi:uncharacterized protein PAE49_020900 [Odontesthes bonariensis]|uniref:uncharacterized protein LOC142369486 n=1 Tax=Odontesthes bonariensis TaxID=219752 RepID=UPI003F58738A
MPLTVRNSSRRRRKNPDEEVPERPGDSSAQVMAPTRMKLRVRRRDNTAAGASGGGDAERSRESTRSSSRRKKSNKNAAAAAASSPPPSSSASARAVVAAEEASPDSKCPICLDRFNNLAYLDRCLHRFCFPCIQEWSHNKAECPLCKQPFASILHSVRAEDDFKEYTLRPPPANSSVAATVAMVAAMASAARSDHHMRLMLRRHRVADGGESATRRRRRERGGRGRGAEERAGVWEWYLDSPPLPLPPLPRHPAVSDIVGEDSEEGEVLEEQRLRGGVDSVERGVIFEGLTGLGGAARQRLQREGGTLRRLRERETVAFRRSLYRCAIRVRGVAGVNGNQGQQRDITADSFRRNPAHLNRLRPWLRRELTVLYGAHGSLVDIVQRIIMARLARHGLEETPTIEEELRPFLLARTEHFLHELVSFARSPLSLDGYDLQAAYEPLAAALDLDELSSSSDGSSVIAISEGEDEERRGRSEERLSGRAGADDDIIQTDSCLSQSGWDDETPGPSYSTAEPSCSLAPAFSPAPQQPAAEDGAERRGKDVEDECLIVGYKKPIAERTPELVQLSSDSEEEEKKKKKEEAESPEKAPPLPPAAPSPYLPTIPPSTSGVCSLEQEHSNSEAMAWPPRARSWSGSSGRSVNSVCSLGAAPSERRDGDGKQLSDEAARERRRKRGRDGSGEQLRKSGTLCNPNRSIYPAMMRRRSPTPPPFSADSGSSLPPSPLHSGWEFRCAQISPLTSSASSPSRSSSSSPLCSSPQPPSPRTPPTPTLSPGERAHHGEKPGGKRKYKSRHLDSDAKDPAWRPSSRERRRERRRRGRQKDAAFGGEGSRRSRADRSPSVEIIYEGTIAPNAAQPPPHKRRRRRHRRTQHSSSPVIITLDSDSSHDGVHNPRNSGSSSPLSSQQTVDFSDLPPLPLVHSAGVGGALDAELGELPADILDQGSEGSEPEPAGPSKAVGRIKIHSDNSDVDVENMEDSSSLLRYDDDDDRAETADSPGPMAAADAKASTAALGESGGARLTVDRVHKEPPEVSDRNLLAAILCDLNQISAPRRELHPRFEAAFSPETPKRSSGGPCEVELASATSPPPLEPAMEVRDVPPLLRPASPAGSLSRNTPPPLKHKDAGSPQQPPIFPGNLHPRRASGAEPAGAEPYLLGPVGQPPIPPISTLKRHFTNALALRGEPPPTSSTSAAPTAAFANHPPPDAHVNHPPPGAHVNHPPPGAHVNHPPPGAHVNHPPPGAHVNHPPPGAHVNHPPPDAHVNHPPPDAHVNHPPPGAHVNHPPPGAHANHPPPDTHVNHPPPDAHVNHPPPGAHVNHPPPGAHANHLPHDAHVNHPPPDAHVNHPPPGAHVNHPPPGAHANHLPHDAHVNHPPPGAHVGSETSRFTHFSSFDGRCDRAASSPVDLIPVNSPGFLAASPGWPAVGPARTDPTSGGGRSNAGSPADLRPPGGVFSGVNSDPTPPSTNSTWAGRVGSPPADLHPEGLTPPSDRQTVGHLLTDGHLNHTALPSSPTEHAAILNTKRGSRSEPGLESHSKLLHPHLHNHCEPSSALRLHPGAHGDNQVAPAPGSAQNQNQNSPADSESFT